MTTEDSTRPEPPRGLGHATTAAGQGQPPASEERVRSVDDALRRADLPESLAALVRETARRTRLRRRERAAVAAELAAHLRDGLDAGQSPAALLESFGRPGVASPLIRRAAIAKRHPLDRAIGRTLRFGSLAVLLVLCIYVAAALRLWWLSPTIRFDPIERFNAMLPSVEGRSAWPLYKEGLRWQKEIWAQRTAAAKAALAAGAPPEESARAEREPGAALLTAADGRRGQRPSPGSPQVTDADRRADADILRAHQKEMATLREAAGRPVLGYPARMDVDPDDAAFFDAGRPPGSGSSAAAPAAQVDFPALSILLPQLAEMRRAGRLLAADAWLAIEDDDGARATDDLVAILGTATHAEENRTLVGQLVASAIRAMASQHIRQAIAEAPAVFDEASLARLAAALAGVPRSAYTLDTTMERLGFEDSVQRVYSDDGDGDGVLLPQAVERLEKLAAAVSSVAVVPAPPARTGGGQAGAAPPAPPVTSSAWDRIEVPMELESALGFVAGPLAALLDPGRRAALAAHTRLMDAAELESRLDPWDPRAGETLDTVEQELFGQGLRGTVMSSSRTGVVVRILGPAVGKAAAERRMSRWRIEAAKVAVALQRFRLAQGTWPANLDALVPTYLAAVPRDPFDGQPLRYALRDGAPVVWSIGNDRVDDGGEPARDEGGLPDPDRVARWTRSAPRPVGFVDPRDGRFIERPAGTIGDWVLWAPRE